MKVCPKCGQEVNPEALMCDNCGEQFGPEVEAIDTEKIMHEQASPTPEEEMLGDSIENSVKGGVKHNLTNTILLIVGLVIVALAVYFLNK
ncbi:zinc ribbon domain-containing protein [Ligilactobacillus ceti]|uniref:Zinc-ribbon domain-containing protein n=1 Tax=Ligilactobacillus ceti DSM 22408 TaxID=1122146 RepID=A0A0R2KJ10_9LACO|nr:zinc ribbon domain-containing protein [Ligilactobacillus ceti]KRN89320.1 hypothetical protein IV53_GL000037 [Ligilactobacillus ceti DSM 22408]